MTKPEVIIIGGGLAGLCCAMRLSESEVPCLLLEASDAVGGRVRTDVFDGFRLDRGFQVFLTAYPEAQRVLTSSALRLRPFYPGANVFYEDKFHRVADPLKRPLDSWRTVFSAVGTLGDKVRLGALRQRLQQQSIESIWNAKERTILNILSTEGFSPTIIDRFFRPFWGGVFLDPALHTSGRMFEFVFKMFAEGDVAIPEQGMEMIPRYLAQQLKPDTIRVGAWVRHIEDQTITLASGERLSAPNIVVATDGTTAYQLLGGTVCPPPQAWRAVTTLYFSANVSPLSEPVLCLNGEGKGLVNHLAVLSDVSPAYAPSGAALISVTVLGNPPIPDSELKDRVKTELKRWFGIRPVRRWRHLKTYRIFQAQPEPLVTREPPKLRDGLYVCGDFRQNASINGAMESGRIAAEAVLKDIRREMVMVEAAP